MQNQRVQDRLQEIHDLLHRVAGRTGLQAHWGRYLCILVASFLENSVTAIYEDYAYSTAGDNVANYVGNQIAFTVGNANADSIARTSGAFSEAWATELRAFMADHDRQSAINTIVSQRNHIAHGRQSTISVDQVSEYLTKCVEVIDFIESQCLGLPQSTL